jgi:LPXTG-motif cell wall-anchored protein
LSGNSSKDSIAAGVKKNNTKNEGITLKDNDTPLGFLPQTGTIPEVAFYVVGALLIVVALAMVVVAVRKRN